MRPASDEARLRWGHNDQSRWGHQCSETTLTGESQFHRSTPQGIWTRVPCNGKQTWWEWSEIAGSTQPLLFGSNLPTTACTCTMYIYVVQYRSPYANRVGIFCVLRFTKANFSFVPNKICCDLRKRWGYLSLISHQFGVHRTTKLAVFLPRVPYWRRQTD